MWSFFWDSCRPGLRKGDVFVWLSGLVREPADHFLSARRLAFSGTEARHRGAGPTHRPRGGRDLCLFLNFLDWGPSSTRLLGATLVDDSCG